MDSRRDMGDARGRSSEESGGNTVGNDLYRETTGNYGTVGGVATKTSEDAREEGYKGGGHRIDYWWLQEVKEKELL